MSLKEQLRVELNEEGSRALEAICRATGLRKTAVIHMVLAEAARRRLDSQPIVERVDCPPDVWYRMDKLPESDPKTEQSSASWESPSWTVEYGGASKCGGTAAHKPGCGENWREPDFESKQNAVEAREQKKAGRKQRKASLAKSISSALGVESHQRVKPHSFHSGVQPVAGCAECASLVTR